MNVLLTFLGNRDPHPDGETENGPVLSLLEDRSFDEVVLICSSEAYIERANRLAEEAAGLTGGIHPILMELASVVDYEEIYRRLGETLRKAVRPKFEHTMPDYFVLLDPGTPQMQTSWFLMVQSGELSARLLQGIPPRFGNGYLVREISIHDAGYPVVMTADRAAKLRDREAVPGSGINEWQSVFETKELQGDSPAFREALTRASRFALHDTYPVLILGESGTGKTEIAKHIHKQSKRHNARFVSVNCASIGSTTAESRLFGHLKGAFTGADIRKDGFFVTADGGTLFLDEIAEFNLEIQAMLLKVLDENVVIPMGADSPRKVDVRIIAATNKNLEEEIREGNFRADLHARLAHLTIDMPSLRDRREDIPPLIDEFITRYRQESGDDIDLSDEVRSMFLDYPWPGNIRELEGTITQMLILANGPVAGIELMPKALKAFFHRSEPDVLPEVALPKAGIDLKSLLERLEHDYYAEALEEAGGVMANAARLLGIQPATFRKALKDRFPDLRADDEEE
jgi:DNA-binding NtrC family response regulator